MKPSVEEQIWASGRAMVEEVDPALAREAEHRFVELITFSEAGVIVAALSRLTNAYFIEFPVWARNLAFRLALLDTPDDATLLRRAAADLRCFGPDWDSEAERLERRADALEGRPRAE